MDSGSSLRLKVSMFNSNDVMKAVVPAEITLQQLHEKLCSQFSVDHNQYVLQYMDEDFRDFINLTSMGDVVDLAFLRLRDKKPLANDVTAASSKSSVLTETCENVRQASWPKEFQLPEFDADVQLYLKGVENTYATSGNTATVQRDIKGKMLDSIANKIYSYTAYASAEQVKQVAKALIEKFPSLQCHSAPHGWEAWAHSISFKMGNFRSKLRKFGCEEVSMNGGKRSKVLRPDAPPPAMNIKKARKGELNFQPNLPASETEASLEDYREQIVAEMHKADPDIVMVNRYMALTFAARRKEVNAMALVATVQDRWPALFTASQVRECHQISSPLKSCSSCYSHIHELCCIHPYLDSKTASTIASSIVYSKLDYCNSTAIFLSLK